MPVKKVKSKKEVKIEAEEPKVKSSRYFYAVGKRKTAVAQVRVYPDARDKQEFLINGRTVLEYFPVSRTQAVAVAPLSAVSVAEKFGVEAKIKGGGINSQAEALRLGIARALIKFDETLRKQLKDLGYLTRDAREVERKKPGLKKARRAPQWAKR